MAANWKKQIMRSARRIAVFLAICFFILWWIIARPIFTTNVQNMKPVKMVNAATLKRHVEILSQDFAPRDYLHPENLDRASRYIRDHFIHDRAHVYDQPYSFDGIEYRNIIAEFGRPSDEIIIVGAHYDSVLYTPGADDNASAIAGLLELSRLLSDTALNSKVVLAAYTLEEPPFFTTGLMGSTVHAKSLKEQGVNVRLMICFEMIGYFTDEPDSQQFPVPFLKLFYPTTGNFIAIVDQLFSTKAGNIKKWMRKHSDMPVHSINAPKWLPGVDWSDHRSFWEYGYPAVMITDTAFYRNLAYHSINDTADRLDYDKMAKVVNGIYGYVEQLANK